MPAERDIQKLFDCPEMPMRFKQSIVKKIEEIALEANEKLANDDQKFFGLQKLLEAQDCFKRSAWKT